MKRFYKHADAAPASDPALTPAPNNAGWVVRLDTRPVRTPGKLSLHVPTQALAEAIAQEWAAQGEQVVPDTMPLTQYACSALDRVAPDRARVCAQAAAFVETDLLLFPCPDPEDLRARQDAAWLPLLEQLRAMGWTLTQAEGLSVPASDGLARATAWLESLPTFELTVAASLIDTCGSFVLTYGLFRGFWAGEVICAASTLEEQFSLETWGEDEEARQLLSRREADLRTLAQMLHLLQ